MQNKSLLEMFEAASSGSKDGVFTFSAEQKAALLVAASGALLTIDEVHRLQLTPGHVVAEGRSERFYVDPEAVLAVRVEREREGTGFRPG